MVGKTKCGEKEQKRWFAQNKQEILNTKLKTGCLEEKIRHKKSMPDITRRKN